MKHHASPDFWTCYRTLPRSVQELADRAYERLEADPRHPSLHFKKVGRLWSVRVGGHHRALAVEANDGCCPECGAVITASTVVEEKDDEDAPESAVVEPEEDEDEDL